jgi:hypothetical protein
VSLASRAGDLYYTFRFVKLLTTPWEETDAVKLGILDSQGKRIKGKKISTSDEKDAYTTFHRLVFNIKRLLNKFPGGSSTISSYAAALVLLREEFNITDKGIEKILKDCELNSDDFIAEQNGWYVLQDKMLSPGIYRVREEKLTKSFTEINAKDKIRVLDQTYPVTSFFGLDVYEAVHMNSNQLVYITLGEIYK